MHLNSEFSVGELVPTTLLFKYLEHAQAKFIYLSNRKVN